MSTDKRDMTERTFWEDELRRVYNCAGMPGAPDCKAYRDYFAEGYTPAEAYLEDLSNA